MSNNFFKDEYETFLYSSGVPYYTTVLDIVPECSNRKDEKERIKKMMPKPHTKSAHMTIKLAPQDQQHDEFPSWTIRTNNRAYMEAIIDWYFNEL